MVVELEFTGKEQELIEEAQKIYGSTVSEIHSLLAQKGLDRRTNKPVCTVNNVALMRRKEDVKG